jgi:hypothetical protein
MYDIVRQSHTFPALYLNGSFIKRKSIDFHEELQGMVIVDGFVVSGSIGEGTMDQEWN